MKRLSFYDSQHIQKVLVQQNEIASIFNRFILSISPYLQQWADRGSNSVWVRNQVIERSVDRELDKFQSMLLSNIAAFNIDAWKRSDMKNDDFIRKYIEGLAISTSRKEGMFAHNLNAMLQLQKGLDARGNTLSDKVWKIADQTKGQLEFYLGSGISSGRNANQISQDVRQLLNDPNRRFRRIKNEDGKLIMSQPMKNYHPGQGVYRSSKMNALRLSVTSTNTAYRTADYERWRQQDFVVGITIQRSGNNKGPCKICDVMCGDYPKTFKFTGFHPFCICFATPKVLDPDNLASFLLDETIPEELLIRTVPESALNWVEKNRERAKGWANTPYFVRDNQKFFGKLDTNTYSLEEKKFTRARSTNDAMQRAIDFFSKEYSQIPNTQLAAIHYYTKAGGNYRQLNKQLYNDGLTEFNEASATLIREGLKSLPIYNGAVYRGTIMKRKEFEALYQGTEEITHKIFTSASQDMAIAQRFASYRELKKSEVSVIFKIQNKTGRNISKISEFNGIFTPEDQKEILFADQIKYKILSCRISASGSIKIELQEL